jgi:hypothetical protein
MNLGELIKAANQLDEADLDRLLIQVMLLRACRKVLVFPEEEAHLLQLINQGIPNDLQEQYKFYRESANKARIALPASTQLT